MANELDARGRRLFALMWTDQAGERAAACNAFVAHCKRIGLHPADAFPAGRAGEAAAASRASLAKHEAAIAELILAIKRKDAAITQYEALVGRLTRALSGAEAEIDRLRASQRAVGRAANGWRVLKPAREGAPNGHAWLTSLMRALSGTAARLARGRGASGRPGLPRDGRGPRAAGRFGPTR